ncbi:NAD(P)/FAD-dependent oxidoreductase [Lyticum sinuosum]|uniref:Ferredoxin--NADP reductase n=1 Tax=Lyticum sinuosum TaxID=1332059 RepID=A0AAE4VKW6_9RICK|nr:NAD(P)/FAD-dependent oxidoreductase [Lyticum sinuosum]
MSHIKDFSLIKEKNISDNNDQIYDIVIIGAGPSGLFAAFQASMLNLKCVIIDSLPQPGGQCSALYPDKPIYDIPGIPEISGSGLISNLLNQLSPFKVEIICNVTINMWEYIDHNKLWKISSLKSNDKKNKKFVEISEINNINTENTKINPDNTDDIQNINFYAKTIIIATGGGRFSHNKPPLNNLSKFENNYIFYSVDNIEIFSNKKVMIAGGGDSAVDWAIKLSEIADKVTLINRRAKFRAMPHSVEKLHSIAANNKIEIITPFQIKSLISDSFTSNNIEKMSGVEIESLDGLIKKIVDIDYLLLFFGLSMDNNDIHQISGLSWIDRYISVNPSTMMTSLHGVFAIGDICYYPGKLKLILTGFAEAALACNSAYAIAKPEKPLHFEYSTSKGIPKAISKI